MMKIEERDGIQGFLGNLDHWSHGNYSDLEMSGNLEEKERNLAN